LAAPTRAGTVPAQNYLGDGFVQFAAAGNNGVCCTGDGLTNASWLYASVSNDANALRDACLAACSAAGCTSVTIHDDAWNYGNGDSDWCTHWSGFPTTTVNSSGSIPRPPSGAFNTGSTSSCADSNCFIRATAATFNEIVDSAGYSGCCPETESGVNIWAPCRSTDCDQAGPVSNPSANFQHLQQLDSMAVCASLCGGNFPGWAAGCGGYTWIETRKLCRLHQAVPSSVNTNDGSCRQRAVCYARSEPTAAPTAAADTECSLWSQTSGQNSVLLCGDGSTCNWDNNYACCADRGGRASCPLHNPSMCATPAQCAGNTAHC